MSKLDKLLIQIIKKKKKKIKKNKKKRKTYVSLSILFFLGIKDK